MTEFVGLLLGLEYLTSVNESEETEEDADPKLLTWEFHDLLFHSRSRMGRHDYPSGATFPYEGEMEPLPAFKEMSPDLPVIPLFKPDIDDLVQNDLSFSLVMEGRRSVREYGDKPITVEQLGEFLYRSARIRRMSPRVEEPITIR